MTSLICIVPFTESVSIQSFVYSSGNMVFQSSVGVALAVLRLPG
jgi:hypothetical protein